ncbi:kinase-like domain-containing protein [Gigaspora rosea]|uniref:Kinase-like domain-containing protein n=1 Tax=Gigaspora rosea TaxID=44941 RepID=A0A397V2U3_9GLOM|nr:kinase-like domain-containing protein [Gigaspora rosea]
MSNNSSSYESDLENSIVLNVNLDALKKSASNVFQVQCTSIQEFNEGGFHKVYILKMEDGKEYIGRLAISVYLQWKTESEVAVMEYIRLNTHIPVPKVYYWNSSVNNPVGKEYILMEYLPVIRLCDIWSNLSIKKKKLFLLKIIDIQLALKKLMFSKIGSIFFDGKNDQFKIGQVIESIFFTGERATLPTIKRGPFKTTKEYILAVIRNQMHYYSMFKSTKQQKYLIPKYEELCQLVPKYFQDDGNNTFVLTHIDFHTSNILVKNDEITGVIDWECSGAFPVKCLCTYPVWITDNPMIEQTNKKSRENILLQKFFRDEMSRRDPDFIRTMDNIDEEKKEFYSTVFSQDV